MFSTAPQTPLQKGPNNYPDTDETLRLAMQKLKQTPLQLQPQQASAGIPHAYVIPIPVVPSENMQSVVSQQQGNNCSNDMSESIDTTHSSAVNNPTTQYQFAPILSEGTGIPSAGGPLPAPLSIPSSTGAYIQYHEGQPLSNFQTFSCTPHGGFFLPAGYRLIYAPPAGTTQSQPATPATSHVANSRDDTPPTEQPHHSTVENTTVPSHSDQ